MLFTFNRKVSTVLYLSGFKINQKDADGINEMSKPTKHVMGFFQSKVHAQYGCFIFSTVQVQN